MKRRVFYHYNKPESRKQDRNVLTVHWRGECIPVNAIVCRVETETHDRTAQPHCVVRGWAEDVLLTKIPVEEGPEKTIATIS